MTAQEDQAAANANASANAIASNGQHDDQHHLDHNDIHDDNDNDDHSSDGEIDPNATPGTKSKKRKERLEQNRISARESRKRKKTMIEELQRTVITLSRENKDLNNRNEELRSQLMEIGTKVSTHSLRRQSKVNSISFVMVTRSSPWEVWPTSVSE